jgi:hypothetical protein
MRHIDKIFGVMKQALSNRDSLIVAGITFFLSTIFSTFFSVSVERYYKASDDAAARLEREQISLEDEGINFQTFMSRYVYSLAVDQKVDPEARQMLIANLIRQKAAAETVLPHLTMENQELVRKYIIAIEKMNEVIPESTDVRDMKAFWERASDLITLRSELKRRLEAST